MCFILRSMDGAVLSVLAVCLLTVLSSGVVHVECETRVCYFGPPPEPDPDNPDDWMKQVMREIQKRCPGGRDPAPGSRGILHLVKEKLSPGETTVAAECLSPAPLGMEDGTIPNDHIRTSNIVRLLTGEGRLNSDYPWRPSFVYNSWIEVDLSVSTVLSGVITQGDRFGGFVTLFQVAYRKQPSSDYEHVKDGSENIKAFTGNIDNNTPVINLLDESEVVTVVRIEPIEWIDALFVGYGLHLELLGCPNE